MMKEHYNHYGFMIIFTAGFTPIPYKIFTISSGAFNISISMFIIASFISRFARYFIVALLIYKYGELVLQYIDRYFNLLTILFSIIFFGGYILINYIFFI